MTTLVEGKHTCQHLVQVAEQAFRQKTCSLSLPPSNAVPVFQSADVLVGRVLGRGAFSMIYEIKSIRPARPLRQNECEAVVENASMYVLKRVQPPTKAQTFVQAVIDISVETRFLAALRHPNILRLVGLVQEEKQEMSHHSALLLDRLDETLDKRLVIWKRKQPYKWLDRKGRRAQEKFLDRMRAIACIADALVYLHDQKIIYRDLKPENLGFDAENNIKLFDFGLACQLPDKHDDNGMFLLTADTGSPRYMDPIIVSFGQKYEGKVKYNELVDVYSISILMWEALALETPFENYTSMKSFTKKVVVGGGRPKCPESWPDSLSDLLRRGWGNIEARPTMKDVLLGLQKHYGLIHIDESITKQDETETETTAVSQATDPTMPIHESVTPTEEPPVGQQETILRHEDAPTELTEQPAVRELNSRDQECDSTSSGSSHDEFISDSTYDKLVSFCLATSDIGRGTEKEIPKKHAKSSNGKRVQTTMLPNDESIPDSIYERMLSFCLETSEAKSSRIEI